MSIQFKVFPICGRPALFNQESECCIASASFEELVKDHFDTKVTPYLIALFEDSTKNSALYDLKHLRQWFASKNWVAENCTSPKTRESCEKIYILGIDKLGNVTHYDTCESIQGFKNSSAIEAEEDAKADHENLEANVNEDELPPLMFNDNRMDIAMAAVRNHGLALQYAADWLRADRDIALAAIRNPGANEINAIDALEDEFERVIEEIE